MVSAQLNSNAGKNQVRAALRTAILLALLAGMSYLSGCAGPAYYWQAATGHLALMHARQPVDEAIASGEADGITVEKLMLSKEIKSFAVEELALPDNGSYSQFVHTGRDAAVWNVVAAPEFSLEAKEWCFPIAGCVPYRGYFDRAKAEHFADRLRKNGLDVAVSPAIAYSTLGWFDDPLLDTMWRHSDAQFAAHLFHELAHQELYVKGDASFNESYASFVERVGVARWLLQRGERDALDQWLAMVEARDDFYALLRETRDELGQIYQSNLPPEEMRAAKRAAFERMNENYREIRDRKWQGRDYFGNWFKQSPNNARLALLETYGRGSCAFAALYEQAGADFERFQELARAKSELPPAERSRWMQRSCPRADIAHDIASNIASLGEL